MSRLQPLTAAAALLLACSAPTAATAAASYRWANTRVDYGSLKVEFCDGDHKTLTKGQKTAKDVCRFWWPNNADMFVWVGETGTVLFDGRNCGNGRWQKLTDKTDTGRTARATVTSAGCP